MMSEVRTARAALRAVMRGPAWHGASILETLDGISASDAAERPIPGAHTIWELVLHMTAWYEVVLDALAGKAISDPPEEQDWPRPKHTTPEHWEAAVVRFTELGQQLVGKLEHFEEDRMSETVPGRNYPYKVLLHGLAHHDAYHLGQIALLKRAVQGEHREFFPVEEEKG